MIGRLPERRPRTFAPVTLVAVAAGLLATSSVGSSEAAAGCDRFASPHGPRHASGSLHRPYRSPQRLVDSLRPGQTGCFLHGTYRFSQLIVDTPRITLRPYRSRSVLLSGEIKVVPSGAGSVIARLRLNGARGKNQIGPRIYADGVVLRGNRITNAHSGICVQVARYFDHAAPRRVVIERNRIHDCGKLPPTNHDHGIYLNEARGTIIRDNWIYDNADRGIQLYPDAQGSTITGNVIAGNGMGIVFSGEGGLTSSDNLVAGNVIANSRVRWNVYSGSDGPVATGNRLRRNCLFAHRRSSHRSHGGVETPSRNFAARKNVIAKPRFVRPGRGDFRLRPSSRCRRVYTGTLPR
jgi:parallel beta-helix repeat protein